MGGGLPVPPIILASGIVGFRSSRRAHNPHGRPEHAYFSTHPRVPQLRPSGRGRFIRWMGWCCHGNMYTVRERGRKGEGGLRACVEHPIVQDGLAVGAVPVLPVEVLRVEEEYPPGLLEDLYQGVDVDMRSEEFEVGHLHVVARRHLVHLIHLSKGEAVLVADRELWNAHSPKGNSGGKHHNALVALQLAELRKLAMVRGVLEKITSRRLAPGVHESRLSADEVGEVWPHRARSDFALSLPSVEHADDGGPLFINGDE